MKSTGMVRHIDDLDRIVIPKELRRILELFPRDFLEISVNENNMIILKKYTEAQGKNDVGILRCLDDLGRIVIPKEICKSFGIEPKDALQIFVENSNIVLCKYEPACIFCHEASETVTYKKKVVCKACINNLTSLL